MKEKKLKLKNSLQTKNFIGGLIIKSSLKIKELNGYEEMKLSQEITESIAKYIETMIFHDGSIQTENLDKRSIVKEVLKQCWELTDDDFKIIDSQLDYLIENKIVKKKGRIYRLYSAVRGCYSPKT